LEKNPVQFWSERMKKTATFEKWIHERMRLFAQPSGAQIAASRNRVLESIDYDRPAPLNNFPLGVLDVNGGQRRPGGERVAVIMVFFGTVGIAGLLYKIPLPSPVTETKRAGTPSIAELKTAVPGSTPQQTATVPALASDPPPAFEVASIRQQSPPLTYLRF